MIKSPTKTIKAGSKFSVTLQLNEEFLDSPFVFGNMKAGIALEQYVYFQLSTAEINSIKSSESFAQGTQGIGAAAYIVIYLSVIFGSSMSYVALTATELMQIYRLINVNHPPNLLAVFKTKLVPDIMKNIGLSSSSNSTNSSNATRLLFEANLPPNIEEFEESANAIPDCCTHFIKLIAGIIAWFFFRRLKRNRPELFDYKKLIGKILLIFYSLFVWNFFYATLITESVDVIKTCLLAMRYTDQSTFDGKLNFAFAVVLYILHLRGIIALFFLSKFVKTAEMKNKEEAEIRRKKKSEMKARKNLLKLIKKPVNFIIFFLIIWKTKRILDILEIKEVTVTENKIQETHEEKLRSENNHLVVPKNMISFTLWKIEYSRKRKKLG